VTEGEREGGREGKSVGRLISSRTLHGQHTKLNPKEGLRVYLSTYISLHLY